MVTPTFDYSRFALHIFVVEDHRDTLECLQMYLEMMGCEVSTANTMAEAMATLPTLDCDVLLSDINLADGSGWDLLSALQLRRPIYAIAMSGFSLGADRTRSQEAGFRHHLPKPFRPECLNLLLREAAREKQGGSRRTS